MNYKIVNEQIIKNRNERNRLKELIDDKIEKISSLNNSELKNINVEFYIDRIKNRNYQLSAIIKTRNDVFLLQEERMNPTDCILPLFNKIEVKLNKKIHKEKKFKLKGQQTRQSQVLSKNIPHLKKLKTEGSKELFDRLLKILVTQLPDYIRRRLKSAQAVNYIKKDKYSLQELIDELFLIFYDNIDEIPSEADKSRIWLYRKTDEFLNEKLKEAEFEKENMERFEELVKIELEDLEENFSIDAEYEIVLTEELDDYKQLAEKYSANDLFISEDEESILSDIMLSLNKEQINTIIKKELLNLPVIKRTIMDLYLIDQMSIEEIAFIKKLSKIEVEAIIREVTYSLKKKLINLLDRL